MRRRRNGTELAQKHATMNLRAAILFLGFSVAVLAADPERTPAPRPRLTQELRSRVENASVHQPRTHSEPRDASGRVAIPQVTIIGGDHGMIGRPEGPTPESRPFDLTEGGTTWSYKGPVVTSETMLQYDPPNAGWDLLRFSF